MDATSKNLSSGSEKHGGHRLALWAIVAIAIALRFALAATRAPAFKPQLDEIAYQQLAQSVLAGRGLVADRNCGPLAVAGHATSVWNCGQPLYLAGVWALAAQKPVAVFAVNALLGGLVVALSYALGAAAFGRRAALVTAALMAVDPWAIHYAASYYTEPAYMALLTASLVLLGASGQRRRHTLAAGALLGLSALFRSTAFYFLPLVIAAGFWRHGRAYLRQGVAFAAAALLVVTPWVVRNVVTHRALVLLDTKAGWNLYYNNHPDAEASTSLPTPPELATLSEVARDRWLRREGLRFVARDPWLFIRRGFDHLGQLWSPWPWTRRPSAGRAIAALYLAALEALALAGAIAAWRRRRELVLLYLLPVFYTALHFVMIGAPRYRLPLDPVLAAFAGHAAVAIGSTLSPWPWSKTAERAEVDPRRMR